MAAVAADCPPRTGAPSSVTPRGVPALDDAAHLEERRIAADSLMLRRQHVLDTVPAGTHLALGARGHMQEQLFTPFVQQTEVQMSVAKVTEISAGSPKSFDDAIRVGLQRAAKTLDQIQGAWVKEQKVVCDGENITEYRVTMKVTFVLK